MKKKNMKGCTQRAVSFAKSSAQTKKGGRQSGGTLGSSVAEKGVERTGVGTHHSGRRGPLDGPSAINRTQNLKDGREGKGGLCVGTSGREDKGKKSRKVMFNRE